MFPSIGGPQFELNQLISTGINLWNQGRRPEAVECFRQAVRTAPGDEHALYRFVAGAYATGQCRAARWAGVSAPASARSERVLRSLAWVCVALGQVDEAALLLRAASEQQPANFELARFAAQMTLYSDTCTPQQIAAAHRRAGAVLLGWGGAAFQEPPARVRAAGEPLRVGYLSQDFRNRSAAHFMEPLLRHHDPAAVTVIAYNAGRGAPDEMTATLRGFSAVWREIGALSDDEAAALVREDRVDVLVDLCGLGGHGRMGVPARRPSPVRVTYLGYPWSTGVPGVQYRLVDALTDPPGAEAYASEELVRLEGCFLCYAPAAHAPAVGEPPSARCGAVTFGSFNSLSKISPTTIRLWAGVLKRVPGSRMLIKSSDLDLLEAQQAMASAFGKEGIDDDRLAFRGPTATPGEHLAAYGEVDIALDTYPYHGTTTTLEAMLMGVPVVTMVGPVHHARVGLSLLTAAGMADLAVATPEAYAQAAARLACDLGALAELRRGLRGRLVSSPLCDGGAFVRRLEAIYGQLLSRAPAG